MATASPEERANARRAVLLTVPELARALGITRFACYRRLREAGVPLRRRGYGTKRPGVFLTYDDLITYAPWIVDGIEHWEALLSRAG